MNNEELNEIEKKDYSVLPSNSIRRQFSTKRGRVRFVTRVAMFSALSYVFYAFLKFPLPFFPPFLEVKFANLFIILSGLLTGPIGGFMTVITMIGIKLITVPTTTSYVGELTDLLLSTLIMLPSALIYLKWHTKKGGIIGIIISYLSWIIFSLIINWAISVPFYISFYFDGSKEALAGMLSATIKGINSDNMMLYYLMFACLPFNVLVGFFNTSISIIVYKKLSIGLKKIGL